MNYVLDILLLCAFSFAVITLIVGLVLLISPDKVHALAARMDVTISTDKYFDLLDSTKYIDRYFYRYHYFFGIFIILGASYTLYILLPLQGEYSRLPEIINPVVSLWLYDALIIALLLLSSFVLLIGIIIFIRPSLLKSFEAKMNGWKDTSGLIKPLDEQRYLEQQKPLKKPRLFGLIVLLGSLYVLWHTAPFIFK